MTNQYRPEPHEKVPRDFTTRGAFLFLKAQTNIYDLIIFNVYARYKREKEQILSVFYVYGSKIRQKSTTSQLVGLFL